MLVRARDPPPHIVTDADRKRWKAAVGVARLWILKAAIKTIRISNQRTWQHRQIDDVITSSRHHVKKIVVVIFCARRGGHSKVSVRWADRSF